VRSEKKQPVDRHPDEAREATALVAVVADGTSRHVVDEHLDELERLVDTAGGVTVDRIVQERSAPDPATMVGSGLLELIADRCVDLGVESVVFDDDLTGSQARNIERALPDDVKVLDRAAVILDIFAQRARSREAQTQVELAQLSYLLPRLTRRWGHLSRQAGGIGTRGVGETQLEIDRRLIGRRISQLKKKLAVIERDRRVRRERRRGLPAIALVGYTNAGKSSLFRRLTGAEVLVEDRLFATLDPRARRVSLREEVTAVLTDTVGFIRKLPHHLVAPFRSTLEEAAEADLVLHVVDSAHPGWSEHLRVGNDVLEGLGVEPSRMLVVLNKVDLLARARRFEVPTGLDAVPVSAVDGLGVDELLCELRNRLLTTAGVEMVRVPLAETQLVERAIGLPHKLAQRFSETVVEVAVRIDPRASPRPVWRAIVSTLGSHKEPRRRGDQYTEDVVPVYEFLCVACNRIYSFHSFRVSPDKTPACPKCEASDLSRVPSRFGVSGGRKSTDGGGAGGDDGPDFDDPRVEREMMRFASELENMDENDPRAMASAVRRMTEIAGEPVTPAMEEMIRRLEAGEDPEKVEEELGEALEDERGDEEGGGGGLGAPERDGGLYPM